jgi:hypothetical protein
MTMLWKRKILTISVIILGLSFIVLMPLCGNQVWRILEIEAISYPFIVPLDFLTNSEVETESNSTIHPINPSTQVDPSSHQDNGYLGKTFSVPTVHYVSKRGNNTDGNTWHTAWNELDQIDWLAVNPGDTIYIDGGTSEMIYTSPLNIVRNGEPEKPITIKLAEEPGRNGKAVFFGGRSTPLPYCGQINYSFDPSVIEETGILILDKSWIVIDGTKWFGIKIHGFDQNGINLNAGSSHITVRNVEIVDNGHARERSGQWRTDNPGVRLAGSNIVFERVVIHDNGQDAFQSGEGVSDFTLRESWLYNLREHPTVNESFNYCTHTDGLQIYGGGSQSGVLIEDSIIGPGLTNGVILGQTLTHYGDQAIVNDVTLRNSLFTKAADNSILGYPGTKPSGWLIDHVTTHCPLTKGHCIYIEGENHTITNSIIYGSRLTLPDGINNYNNNCQWETEGVLIGETVQPQFIAVNESDPFSLDDYTVEADSSCARIGSHISSVSELLGQFDPFVSIFYNDRMFYWKR